jgi:uroporphyrinogen decarboxylase
VESPYSTAGCVCGPEKLNRWLIKRPDVAHHLLQLVTNFVIDTAKYWKDKFGTENSYVQSGEPLASNDMISPRHFEQFVFPYLKQVYEELRSLGYKYIHSHICGEQNANLPYWSRLPMGDPGIISIGHEVDILRAAEYFPNDIILGNLEPAIIQTGTPQQVYEASREVIEKGKMCSGGFIFASGCQLPPMSPSENILMMTKAAEDFGWYE